MGNVVRLRTPMRRDTHSEAFLEAWAAYPRSGQLRSSKRESWPVWVATAAEVGEEDLARAVARYAKEDKGHRGEAGAPAFHRWLKWGRWEHWLGEPETQAARLLQFVRTFPEPELRADFSERFGAKATAWLDRCGWDHVTREISSPTRALKVEWIEGPFMRWMKEQGVKALVFQ